MKLNASCKAVPPYPKLTLKNAILEAQMQGLRNPAFPDDLVGWLDDDFDDDDPFGGKKKDEDEKK